MLSLGGTVPAVRRYWRVRTLFIGVYQPHKEISNQFSEVSG
jgi:hypothetical protein